MHFELVSMISDPSICFNSDESMVKWNELFSICSSQWEIEINPEFQKFVECYWNFIKYSKNVKFEFVSNSSFHFATCIFLAKYYLLMKINSQNAIASKMLKIAFGNLLIYFSVWLLTDNLSRNQFHWNVCHFKLSILLNDQFS